MSPKTPIPPHLTVQALRGDPERLGYSIYELRACAYTTAQPGAPTGRCALAAEAAGLRVVRCHIPQGLWADLEAAAWRAMGSLAYLEDDAA